MNPIQFKIEDIAKMLLLAIFVVKEKEVKFFYLNSNDTLYVLVDNNFIGFFKGDNTFKDPSGNILKGIVLPRKPQYSFEKEFIPAYVSCITEYILLESL